MGCPLAFGTVLCTLQSVLRNIVHSRSSSEQLLNPSTPLLVTGVMAKLPSCAGSHVDWTKFVRQLKGCPRYLPYHSQILRWFRFVNTNFFFGFSLSMVFIIISFREFGLRLVLPLFLTFFVAAEYNECSNKYISHPTWLVTKSSKNIRKRFENQNEKREGRGERSGKKTVNRCKVSLALRSIETMSLINKNSKYVHVRKFHGSSVRM